MEQPLEQVKPLKIERIEETEVFHNNANIRT